MKTTLMLSHPLMNNLLPLRNHLKTKMMCIMMEPEVNLKIKRKVKKVIMMMRTRAKTLLPPKKKLKKQKPSKVNNNHHTLLNHNLKLL